MRARRAFTSDGQARATKHGRRRERTVPGAQPERCRDERATGAECGPSAGPDERATAGARGQGRPPVEVPPLSSRSR